MIGQHLVHDHRRVPRPGLRPWGLAALALALLATDDAPATEVPFGSESVISTNAHDAYAVFAADGDGDMSDFSR